MTGTVVALGMAGAALWGQAGAARRITWADIAPLRSLLEARGLSASTFDAYVDKVRAENVSRVRDGDLDHLIFYLLQSTRFTSLAPIEPALSAKAVVESLRGQERDSFLKTLTPAPAMPAPVRARMAALLRALDSPTAADPRLVFFRALMASTVSRPQDRQAALTREYLRVVRFVYEKEFVAQASSPEAVAELYRARGLSTDTAVESGFLVYFGLGTVRELNREQSIRRVLIVGPGLDLAPRTALQETGPPQSYQPWAVIDALVALGLANTSDLQVVAADINPRVVEHLRQPEPPTLSLMSEIRDSDTVTLTPEYRDYFTRLGRAIVAGDAEASTTVVDGHLRKIVPVDKAARRVLTAAALDAVTERLDAPPFDLVIATNILPYFDDVQLLLAMSNVAAMLKPGGVFLHNEVRPLMDAATSAVGLPFEHARYVTIANVKGAASPLFDRVFVHRRADDGAARSQRPASIR